ncbi:MAG: hypothetical protein QGG36_08065 [Pirellulaceae bacterium]|jgi:hypothetical protein|nr:hypothetical protein [Pirellulaceae bacterium]MDP7015738.1 hypothetical protein [Pirellulaceae bacterium]
MSRTIEIDLDSLDDPALDDDTLEQALDGRRIVLEAPPTNTLGTAGFWVSLMGLILTCGALCPLGVFFSGLALFRKPRGMAFAGAVTGMLGCAWLATLATVFGVSIAGATMTVKTGAAMATAQQRIEKFKTDHGSYPSYEQGNELIGDLADGFQKRIRYHAEGARAVITSAGPDREFDTADDITNKNQVGGPFGQFTDALDKLNKPADVDQETGGILEQALGGGLGGAFGAGGGGAFGAGGGGSLDLLEQLGEDSKNPPSFEMTIDQ